MESKIKLRQRAKAVRKSLNLDEKSLLAVAKIQNSLSYKNANNILIYYPLREELNLLKLCDDEKKIFLPRVFNDELQICPFKQGDKLKKSEFNVYEPCSDSINPNLLDLVIVPALMADKDGYRLGYGGGFYDRFLSKNQNVKTILPIAKELYVKELPHEKYDIPIDEVIVV